MIVDDLARFGPDRAPGAPVSLSEAQAYCRRLATTHYENFVVASWLLPRRVRQHLMNVYAYCRWADDLGDEVAIGGDTLAYLDWWEEELAACYRGQARHPVFVALKETIAACSLPSEPLHDLLAAFRRDQWQDSYETFDDLLAYCAKSANPVGRIVLHVANAASEENVRLADSICTGLQLANFWQDVARDYDIGRVYLPRQTLREFGYREAMLARRETNAAFRQVMRFEVDRAERFLKGGMPLARRVPRWLRTSAGMFIHGGLSVLQKIRRLDYDVWMTRVSLSKWDKWKTFARTVCG